jgi:uncharacterized RDD family membrane protein YckC
LTPQATASTGRSQSGWSQPGWEEPQQWQGGAYATVEYAGFLKRLGAVVLDWLILTAVAWVAGFGLAVLFALGGGLETDESVDNFSAFFSLVAFLGQWLYYAIMESSAWQATIGKRALGIIVTDDHGQRISFGRATGRYFAKILSAIVLLIGYIMAAFTEKKQGLHDMIAGTLVVVGKTTDSRPF